MILHLMPPTIRHICQNLGHIKAISQIAIVGQTLFKVSDRAREVLNLQGNEAQRPQTVGNFASVPVGLGQGQTLFDTLPDRYWDFQKFR